MAKSKLTTLRINQKIAIQPPESAEINAHIEKVTHGTIGNLAAAIARELNFPEKDAKVIEQVAPFHDIGMLYVPESIISSSKLLGVDEKAIIRTHVPLGLALLHGGNTSHIRTTKIIIETHHERWDGSGYPYKLEGIRIPKVGQVVAIADVFTALTSERPHRKALSPQEAKKFVLEQSGKEFDPTVVAAFDSVMQFNEDPQQDEAILQGKLNLLGLYDLLNSFIQNQVTGKLRIYSQNTEGLILLNNGKLIHARINQVIGEEAMVTLLKVSQESDASFRLEPLQEDMIEEFISIETPTTPLLLSTAVKLDHLSK